MLPLDAADFSAAAAASSARMDSWPKIYFLRKDMLFITVVYWYVLNKDVAQSDERALCYRVVL
jgi:hypothetical protein